MPIVIPLSPGTVTSGLQSLATLQVYDYEYTPDNLPLVNGEILVWLAYDNATMTGPAVVLESKRNRVTTDANGYWTLNLVGNLMITPAGTYYVVRTPFRTYRFTIPGGLGPFQASANLAP
jgi:hypothetical protein